MRRRSKIQAVALRLLCAALLVFVGMAHRPMAMAASEAADLAAYVLPDGTVPSLCLNDGDTTKPGKHRAADHGCEACRIAAATVLPSPPNNAEALVRVTVVETYAGKAERFDRLLFPPSAPPRGPPSFSDFI